MHLSLLLADIPDAFVDGPVERDITGIATHSAAVRPGEAFVAIRGFTHDGHTFVGDAVARGAVAVVVERLVEVPPGVTRVRVPDTRLALALLSSEFYRHPSREVKVIGVTGTNGKGTTAYLVEALLSRAGLPCGIIGTMGAKLGPETVALDRTTPEAPEFQTLLRRIADARYPYAVVEVASHALALHRVDGCRFHAAVFTNLTQDHLDFHRTLDEYRTAKRRLFEMVDPNGVSVVNADDPSAEVMASASRAPVITYGIERGAQVRAEEIRLGLDGADFVVHTPWGRGPVASRLQGRFNISNTLAAIAVALSQGVALEDVPAGLAAFRGVPGRFEAIDEGQPFGVVVDYAHTPDGLQNVLRTARDFVTGRTIVVFGAGGDRDRTKRPLMGAIAARLAHIAIVTSDNPRSEEPMAIIDEIMIGVRGSGSGVRVEVEPDRRKAICRAIEVAQPGDFVIIAGKGHEPYQEINGVKYPFDDRIAAREALKNLRAPGTGHWTP